ncbi:MAG: hypothetical protein EA347_01440 [Thioalkalivibrio sp.]|nr:MAG: hypothetical protein EA347_01440 [Thioalkalivibrio sp.]
MRFMLRSKSTTRNPQFELGLLVLATGLVITLQNPAAMDSASQLISEMDLPSPAHILEWRPDGPPPWMDGDQMMTEEIEEVPALTTLSRDGEPVVDPRERPQR